MIGLFDSGYGGLSVFSGLAKRFPKSDFLYLGDNARAPYGNHSKEVIEGYSKEALMWLFDNGVDVVIAACNTVSAEGLPGIREWLDKNFPNKKVFGVIEPTVSFVLEKVPAKNGLAVIGTNATIRSKAYSKAFEEEGVSLLEVSTPLLAPLVEFGEVGGAMAEHIIAHYIAPLTKRGVSDLILGCTHYYFLRETIEKMYPHLNLYDASDALPYFLEKNALEGGGEGRWKFYTTEETDQFSEFVLDNLGIEVRPTKVKIA